MPQPLQQLCNIIKAIASNEEHKKPVMDKAEATALALGIAKLMKIKSGSNEPTAEDEQQSGEIVSKHLDADFSCFLCRKKCRSRARFLLHFKRHFNKAKHETSSSDEDEKKAEQDHFPIHLRGLTELDKRPKPGRPPKTSKRKLHVQDHDGDSGCHSADDGGSSSNGELTSDCPGDSEESSDDSSQLKSQQQLEKCFARSKKAVANPASKTCHQDQRLSLAEKQLDNNDTDSLVCMTCLKRFSNCQNLRRHLRLHIARDSIKPDYEELEGDENENEETVLDGPKKHKGRFLCDWCPLRFDNRSAARIHEATHKGQEPKCYVCSKQYADRYSLRYHLRTHGIGMYYSNLT